MRAGKKGRSEIRVVIWLALVAAAIAIGAFVLGGASIALADATWG